MKGCDQCQVISINGVPCHETGCPKSYINPATGKGYKEECVRCGRTFRIDYKGQRRCKRCGG